MNAQKIKIALAAGLINHSGSGNVLQTVRDIMHVFAAEIGNFLTLAPVAHSNLGSNMVRESYALRYEHLTINLDLISNRQEQVQTVQRFSLG